MSRTLKRRYDGEISVGGALRGWPPLFSVEDIGTGATVTYVDVRLNVIFGKHYPFSELHKCLVEHDIVAEIVGLDTTHENDHPRLILEVSQEGTVIDEEQLRHLDEGVSV